MISNEELNEMIDQNEEKICINCPLFNICLNESCLGICEGDTRSQREMLRDAGYANEQKKGADYGNI